MEELKNEIVEKQKPLYSWLKIDKNDYAKYGITNLNEAKVLISFIVGDLKKGKNTVTLYDYGDDSSFINELSGEYKELQMDIKEQEEYGIFPEHWEMFGINKLYSAIKLIHNPIMHIIDVFFIYNNNVYCYHTYLPEEEKNLDLVYLVKKYENIRHIIKNINELTKN